MAKRVSRILTDEQWAVLLPLFPEPKKPKGKNKGGCRRRPRSARFRRLAASPDFADGSGSVVRQSELDPVRAGAAGTVTANRRWRGRNGPAGTGWTGWRSGGKLARVGSGWSGTAASFSGSSGSRVGSSGKRGRSSCALGEALSGEPHLRVPPAARHPLPLPFSPGLSRSPIRGCPRGLRSWSRRRTDGGLDGRRVEVRSWERPTPATLRGQPTHTDS
jgi:hypothetical protein